MLVRIRYEPTAAQELDIRQLAPTAGVVGYDPVDQKVILNIPDDDAPAELHKLPANQWRETHVGRVLIKADDSAHEAWHQHLDHKYQEHAGRFRPQVA